MSEQVQSILEAVRHLGPEQRRELAEALAAMETPIEVPTDRRKQLVDSTRGKYRHVPTSSEAFMSRKREENADRESRS
jgi:hypothetical protein